MRSIIWLLGLFVFLAGCGNNLPKGIWVDFNGTCRTPLVLYYWKDSLQAYDTASLRSDGIYLFKDKPLEFGYYQIRVDSVRHIDVILHTDSLVKINSRLGYLDETTFSGSTETQKWYQIQKINQQLGLGVKTLRDQMVSPLSPTLTLIQKDSLFRAIQKLRMTYRNFTDSLVELNQLNWFWIPCIHTQYNEFLIWNLFDDYGTMYQSALKLKELFPLNEQVSSHIAKLELLNKQMEHFSKFLPGKRVPNLHWIQPDLQTIQLNDYLGRRVIMAIHDTIASASYWEFKVREAELLKWKAKEYQLIAFATDTLWQRNPKPSTLSYPIGVLDSVSRLQINGIDKPLILWIDAQGVIEATNLSEAAALEKLSHIE